MELFRREALDGQDRLHGDIVFVPQISWRMLCAFFLASLALASLYLFSARYRPATPVAGRLVGHAGALVASFEVPSGAAKAIASGETLRIAVPGAGRTLDARVTTVVPSQGGSTIVQASLGSSTGLDAGMPVRTALPSRPRTLAATLLDNVTGRGRE